MAAYFCPHCKAKTTFVNHGPNIGWQGRAHTIWECHDCGGVVYARGTTGSDDVELYPSVRSEAPDDYPPDVQENFSEALRSLNVNNPRAAVVMARAALQAATREQGANGDNLKQEIEDLAARHVIPEALRDWAHELRDGGNLVAHPEPDKKVEMQDAEELMALAESIFEYLYVVPKEVEQRRGRLAEQQEAPPEDAP